MIKRTHCKRCKTGALRPTPKVGARTVYCPSCDRDMNQERYIARKATKAVADVYYSTKKGYVYIITNPAFPDWIKVGCALNAQDRLRSFQTSSPHRDYRLYWAWETADKLESERKAHKLLEERVEKKGEWFLIEESRAKKIIKELECLS